VGRDDDSDDVPHRRADDHGIPSRAGGRRQRGVAFVSTWVFVAGYLAVWTLAGVVAFAAAVAAEAVAQWAGLSTATAARIGGALLVLAGLYQFTPWKNVCLIHCRTPTMFIVTFWREGVGGAFWMGAIHGSFCLGCCWLLFLVLFPLGIMNIAAMAVITFLVFAEKTLPWGHRIAQMAAVVLIIYGGTVLIKLTLLPTLMSGSGMMMPDKMPTPERQSEPMR
jgi:predicted metal-binding membrane protein